MSDYVYLFREHPNEYGCSSPPIIYRSLGTASGSLGACEIYVDKDKTPISVKELLERLDEKDWIQLYNKQGEPCATLEQMVLA